MAMMPDRDTEHKVIEVLSLSPCTPGGTLKARCTVRLAGIVLRGVELWQLPFQQAWVELPRQKFTTSDGLEKFADIIELRPPLMREVERVCRIAWERGSV